MKPDKDVWEGGVRVLKGKPGNDVVYLFFKQKYLCHCVTDPDQTVFSVLSSIYRFPTVVTFLYILVRSSIINARCYHDLKYRQLSNSMKQRIW